jgi:hypothetical protein
MSTTTPVQPKPGAGLLAVVEQVVETVTTWQLCACANAHHSPDDREEPKATRDEAARGLLYYPAGTAHLLRTTAVVVAEPLDDALDVCEADAVESLHDAQPYDPSDEHDYFRDDEWRTA